MIKEIWQDIPDYLGLYKVSNFGRVQSLARYVPRKNGQMGFVPERELKPGTDRHGYKNVVLSKNGTHKTFTIHKLVALAFIPNPEQLPEIDHKDGTRTNNRVENLQWVTRKQNANNPISKYRYSEMAKARKPYKSLQKRIYQIKDGVIINEFASMREAERITGVAHSSIRRVISGTLKMAGGFVWKDKSE